MQLLDTLCKLPKFQKLLGQEKPDDEKESDREVVLRFFAMKRSMPQFGRIPLAYFLNKVRALCKTLGDSMLGHRLGLVSVHVVYALHGVARGKGSCVGGEGMQGCSAAYL